MRAVVGRAGPPASAVEQAAYLMRQSIALRRPDGSDRRTDQRFPLNV